MAQRKRAGPITQRSEDQNLALLDFLFFSIFFLKFSSPFPDELYTKSTMRIIDVKPYFCGLWCRSLLKEHP